MKNNKNVNADTQTATLKDFRNGIKNQWNEDTRTITSLINYFKDNYSNPLFKSYIKELNAKHKGANLTMSTLTQKALLKFAYVHELNNVTESYELIAETGKKYFSIAFMLRLAERKAKFTEPTSKAFIEAKEQAVCRTITRLVAKRIANERKAQLIKLGEDFEKAQGVSSPVVNEIVLS